LEQFEKKERIASTRIAMVKHEKIENLKEKAMMHDAKVVYAKRKFKER
jgi:hypothetical protein